VLQKSLLFNLFFVWCILTNTAAQNVVAFQGGEGTAADTWGYVPISNAGGPIQPGIVSVYPLSGTKSIRAGGGNTTGCSGGVNCLYGGGGTGCPMHGKAIEFNPVNVACLSDVQLSCYHRSHILCGGGGSGFDSGERVYFEVRLNGGSWVAVDTLGTINDYTWTYATNPAGNTTLTVPNPFVYNVPPGTNTIAFRVRATLNRSDEVFYVDDVKLTTSTTAYNFPGTAGLWNGEADTDWNNPCNWDIRQLPDNTSDVYIPNSASNICEVFAGDTANCYNLRIDKSKLAVESFTSIINVFGNLTIESNGFLDMSLAGNEGGVLNLHGDWINKGDENFFDEGRSTVNFTGTANQLITVDGDTKEAFYKLRVNKTSGILITNDDIWIDPLNIGGATAMLTLSGGFFDLNSRELKLWNDNFQAVSRTGGGVISERNDNSSRFTRTINSNTGSFIFPFVKTTGAYLPFIFNPVSGNAGDVTVATYGTPPNNLPWPSSPVAVSNLISGVGLSPDNRDATVDRFWQIDPTGTVTANLTFNYAPGELPVAPFDNAATMKAQRYDPGTSLWQPYLPGQGANFYFVYAPAVSIFSTWTLTNEISPLPIELLIFDANLNNKNEVDLKWVTASEINNDYFTLEKSRDGMEFSPFTTVTGAGNTSNVSYYETVDNNPYDGISYYRLKQTDYDGRYSHSHVVKISNNLHASIPFSIFPNPALDYFYISVHESNNHEQIFIRDLTGKLVRVVDFASKEKTGSNLYRINRDSLAKGMYFVTTIDGHSQKLVLH